MKKINKIILSLLLFISIISKAQTTFNQNGTLQPAPEINVVNYSQSIGSNIYTVKSEKNANCNYDINLYVTLAGTTYLMYTYDGYHADIDDEIATGLHVSSSGIYIVGTHKAEVGGATNILTLALTSSANPIWIQEFDNPDYQEFDAGGDLYEEQGYVHVIGSSSNGSSNPGSNLVWLVYNATSGTLCNSFNFSGPSQFVFPQELDFDIVNGFTINGIASNASNNGWTNFSKTLVGVGCTTPTIGGPNGLEGDVIPGPSIINFMVNPSSYAQQVFANAGNNVTINTGGNTTLNGSVSTNTTFVWSPTTGLSNATILNPIASPTATTNYTLTATSQDGCSSNTSSLVVSVSNTGNIQSQFFNPGATLTTTAPACTTITSSIGTTTPCNLILNGAMDNPSSDVSAQGQVGYLPGWCNLETVGILNLNTSDLFTSNPQNINGFVIPNVLNGFQNANTGNAYIGAALLEVNPNNRREWFYTTQTLNLTPTQKYYISFNTNLYDKSEYALKNWGLSFRDATQTGSPNNLSCDVCVTNFITDMTNWTKVSGAYIADGTEKDICIHYNLNTSTQYLPGDIQTTSAFNGNLTDPNYNQFKNAYYFFDDFIVQPLADAGPDKTICLGSSATIGSLCPINDPTKVQFLWSPSTGLSSTTIANPIASPTSTTTYTVIVTYTNGTNIMVATDNVTVFVNPVPTITIPSQTICVGQQVNLTPTSNITPLTNQQWLVSNNMPPYNMGQNGLTFTPNAPITYSITYSAYSLAGCIGIANATITGIPSPAAPAFTGPLTSCNSSQTYTVTNPQVGITYTWSIVFIGGSNMTNLTGNGNSITCNYQNWEGDVILTATSANGCSKSTTLRVFRCECPPDPIKTIYYFDGVNSFTSYSTSSIVNTQGALNTIYVSGVLNITQNLTLLNIDVVMLPNAKINVSNGINFTLNNCVVKACTKMWDGIYVNFPTSSLNVIHTTIQDGINAISSSNGGIINVNNNSVFNKNYKHITISNYTNSAHTLQYPGIIQDGTLFTCSVTPTSPGNTLGLPYANLLPAVCIEINNVDNINIGNGTLIGKNIFERATYGINYKQSNVVIKNNEFRNILNNNASTTYVCPCLKGTAICGRGYTTATTANLTKATIGGQNTLDRNIIYNGVNAIDLRTNINTDIRSNKIYNMSNTGINLENNLVDNSLGHFIFSNIFDNINNIYIKLNNNNLCKKTIDQNSFNQTSGINLSLGYEYTTAISITEPNTNATTLNCITDIRSNIIDKTRIGIDCNNVKNLTILQNNVGLFTVPFNNANQQLSLGAGIKAAACKNLKILDNTVLAANQWNWWTQGVWVSDCINNIIECNAVSHTGIGLRFDGFNSGFGINGNLNQDNRVRKNRMDNNYFGLWVHNGRIGEQFTMSGTTMLANRNFWTGSYPQGTFYHTRFDWWSANIPTNYQAQNSRLYVPNFPNSNNYSTWSEVQCPGCGMNPSQFSAYSFWNNAVTPLTAQNQTNILKPGTVGQQSINVVLGGGAYNSNCSSGANNFNIHISAPPQGNGEPIIATEATLTPELSAAWWEKYNLYKQLIDDPSQAQINSEVQTLLNSMEFASIVQLEEIRGKMTDSVYQECIGMAVLKQMNSGIVANNPLEEYFREVNEQYLNIYSINVDSMPDSSSMAYLVNVAQLCPAIYGPAVHYARGLLRKFEFVPTLYVSSCEQSNMPNGGSGNRSSNIIQPLPATEFGFSPMPNDDEEIELIETNNYNIYPNPANDILIIEGNWNNNVIINVSIVDNLGNAVLNTDISNKTLAKINLSKFASGLYFIRIFENGEFKKAQKLTIIK